MQSDTLIRLDIHRPIRYRWGGLFVAPNAGWIHMQRRLADFEFIVIQRGTLYIADDNQEYEAHEGEYLLMPPTARQCGSRPSDCSFYWMHFVTDPMDGYEKFQLQSEGELQVEGKLQGEGELQSEGEIHNEGETLTEEPNRCEENPDGEELVKSDPLRKDERTDERKSTAVNVNQETEKHQFLNYEPGCLLLHEHATLTSAPRVHSMMQLLADTERRYSDQEANSFLATAVLCEVQNQLRTALHLHNEKETVLFEAINDYISRHIGERLHVKDVAEHFGYNEKYLTTLFREKTGTSLKAHIISQKMERAKFLLCNTSAAISEISYNLSYWDEQSFSSAFKRFTGMSPTEYRRMYSAGLVNHV